jgi:hypothetical protein
MTRWVKLRLATIQQARLKYFEKRPRQATVGAVKATKRRRRLCRLREPVATRL